MDLTDNDYLLLTPGPLSTSITVRQAMLKDWCTWDEDYNIGVVEWIRHRLVTLATHQPGYSAVLMQGSGTASVEAVIGSAIPDNGKLLVINNGVYGQRIRQIAGYFGIPVTEQNPGECRPANPDAVAEILAGDTTITHVAMVHCETTTGLLNPLEAVCQVVKQSGRVMIVDAMSSFGGIPMDIGHLGIDFLISSANKCIQGVPGFGFVIARQHRLEQCQGQARSLSLDLYDQWQCMNRYHGKWRFTSPTHTVRAFQQALKELDTEGGITARFQRYTNNQQRLVAGMEALGFCCLLPRQWHSPIITSFLCPTAPGYDFQRFYQQLKQRGFVIYPGKVSDADCFRIGHIGEVYPRDIDRLLAAVEESMDWINPGRTNPNGEPKYDIN